MMNLLTPDLSATEVASRCSCSGPLHGFPSPASDYLEGGLDLSRHCISHPTATFYLRAEGT